MGAGFVWQLVPLGQALLPAHTGELGLQAVLPVTQPQAGGPDVLATRLQPPEAQVPLHTGAVWSHASVVGRVVVVEPPGTVVVVAPPPRRVAGAHRAFAALGVRLWVANWSLTETPGTEPRGHLIL